MCHSPPDNIGRPPPPQSGAEGKVRGKGARLQVGWKEAARRLQGPLQGCRMEATKRLHWTKKGRL